MTYTPKTDDFVHKDEIKDKATLDRIHATATDQEGQKKWGQWGSSLSWRGLGYRNGGYWAWGEQQPENTTIDLATLLGPDRLEPGQWVEVQYAGSGDDGDWHKHWLVGYDQNDRPVTSNPKYPDIAVVRPKDRIRAVQSRADKALAKLAESDLKITPATQRTVAVLDTLGLLQE